MATMDHSLYVLHLSKSSHAQDVRQLIDINDWYYFETCLRYIWISKENTSPRINSKIDSHFPMEIFYDYDAYKFLLQTLCGLKSPVIGETEVFGQFKQQFLNPQTQASSNNLSKSTPLYKKQNTSSQPPNTPNSPFILSLISDTKAVRKKFLKNLGSQSYGSLSRKWLRNYNSLDIIGAGQLVKSLLSWLIKESLPIRIFSRDPSKWTSKEPPEEIFIEDLKTWAQDGTSRFNSLNSKSRTLFICAPIKSCDPALKKSILERYDFIVDFRENSHLDRIPHPHVKTLKVMFHEIEKNSKEVLHKKKLAFDKIQELSTKYFNKMTVRPFGWDDLYDYSFKTK